MNRGQRKINLANKRKRLQIDGLEGMGGIKSWGLHQLRFLLVVISGAAAEVILPSKNPIIIVV